MLSSLSVLYVGPPGIGKTSIIKQTFEHTEVLLLSSATEEDIAGIPYHKNGIEYRTSPAWVERLKKADKEGKTTCLFLDELDKARREVADTMLTLVVSKEQFGVPSATFLRAAANPPEWGGGDGISDPMISRWSVVPFTMTEERVNDQLQFWENRYRNTPAQQCIEPLLEIIEKQGWVQITGEGLNRRIASPRTITMALDAVNEGQDVETIVNGLLPSVFVTAFLRNTEIHQTLKRVREHGAKTKNRELYRITP